jgi:NDP-sugar pyrophosphorylase family protein
MINVVVPLTLPAKETEDTGHAEPRPFIPVAGRPLVQHVVDNIRPSFEHQFVYIVDPEVMTMHRRRSLGISSDSQVVYSWSAPRTMAAAVCMARESVDMGEPLVIAGCEQFIDVDLDRFYIAGMDVGADAAVLTFPGDRTPKYPTTMVYKNRVVEMSEHRVISEMANAGVYYFKDAQTFFDAAVTAHTQTQAEDSALTMSGIFNSMVEGGANVVPCPLPEGAFRPLHTSIDLSLFEARANLKIQSAA